MLSDTAITAMIAFFAFFLVIVVAGQVLDRGRNADLRRVTHRLRGLSPAAPAVTGPGGFSRWLYAMLPRLSAYTSAAQHRQTGQLQIQLLRAGFFEPSSLQYFLGAKLALTLALAALGGLAAWWFGAASSRYIALGGLAGCAAGMVLPSVWLSAQVRRRQARLRNTLPDALDMLVLCLEGGASFNAAMQRVTDDLQAVHPALGVEMNIVQREMQLGLSAGDALKKFADRCGLADVRDLAMVILQSERYGASISKALRTYADSARVQRQQQAEETAQKAAVKILFPTLFCIFPAIFIVILGPAAYQTAKLFSR
jgi:tight adherence protein C